MKQPTQSIDTQFNITRPKTIKQEDNIQNIKHVGWVGWYWKTYFQRKLVKINCWWINLWQTRGFHNRSKSVNLEGMQNDWYCGKIFIRPRCWQFIILVFWKSKIEKNRKARYFDLGWSVDSIPWLQQIKATT